MSVAIDILTYIHSQQDLKQYWDEPKNYINRMSDAVWTVTPLDIDMEKPITINFSNDFGEIPTWQEVLFKQLCKPEAMNKATKRGGRKVIAGDNGSISSLKRKYDHCKVNLKFLADYLRVTDIKSPVELTNDVALGFLEWVLLCKRGATIVDKAKKNQSEDYYSNHTYTNFVNFIEGISKLTQLGYVKTGLVGYLSKSDTLDRIPKTVLSKFKGFDFINWINADNKASLSLAQQIAMMTACVDFLESDRCKIMIALVRSIQKYYPAKGSLLVLNTIKLGLLYRRFGGFQDSRSKSPSNRSNYIRLSEILRSELKHVYTLFPDKNDPEKGIDYTKLKDELKEFMITHDDIDPMKDTRALQFKVIYPALIVFASMAGARQGELESIRHCDIEQDEHGNYQYRSAIEKTNHGIKTMRWIGGYAAQIVDRLRALDIRLDCSASEDECEQRSLFSALTYSTNMPINSLKDMWRQNTKTGTHYSANQFSCWVEYWLNEQLHETLRTHYFGMHSFRHTWAEFALRRFDGMGVPELIRLHFRHSFGSYFLDHYLRDKIKESDDMELTIEQRYMADIVGKVANGDMQIYGAAVNYLKKAVSEIKAMSLEEFKVVASQYSTIDVHEYGICAVREGSESLAQCYDKKSATPQTGLASWSKCGPCANRLSPDWTRDALISYGATLNHRKKDFLELGMIIQAERFDTEMELIQKTLKGL